MTRLLASTIVTTALLLAWSESAFAQGGRGFIDPAAFGQPTQVLSTNPIGLALRYYNVEYESRVTDAITGGIGGASLSESLGFGSYLNGDVFLRYYPGGHAFQGVSLGLKAGLTSSNGVAAGIGFDLNANHWINERVVMSAGVGLKRVFDGADTYTLPTIRIINVGIAF